MNFKKKVILLVSVCAIICISSVGVVTASTTGTKTYNTTSLTHLVSVSNDTSGSLTLAANTQPAVGTGGVKVSIRKSNGATVASKTFPYYTTTSDLTATVPSGEIRRIYVTPATSGQQIKGTLKYSY